MTFGFRIIRKNCDKERTLDVLRMRLKQSFPTDVLWSVHRTKEGIRTTDTAVPLWSIYCCWRRSANWCFERPLNCRPHTHARTHMHTGAHTRTHARAYIHTRTKTRTQARIRTHTQTHPTGGWRFRLRRDRWNSKPNTMTTQSSYMLRPAAARKCVYFCHK